MRFWACVGPRSAISIPCFMYFGRTCGLVGAGRIANRKGDGDMGRSMTLGWRCRNLAAILLAFAGAAVFSVTNAFADSGNPITGTIRASDRIAGVSKCVRHRE